MKSRVTKMRSRTSTTPMPTCCHSGSMMFSKCVGLASKAPWMLGTFEPVPTFSPSFTHVSAGISFGRFMLWARRHDDAKYDDQRRATLVSAELDRRAGSPWAARTWLVAARNWASAAAGSAPAGDAGSTTVPTVANAATVAIRPYPSQIPHTAKLDKLL